MPQSISLFSVNSASAAMPSLAARSRIPVRVNDSVVPAAASRLPVKTADDVATLFAAMSVSMPTTVKPTSASPSTSHASRSKLPIATAISATEDCPPSRQHQQRSLAKIAPSVNSASVSDRIAERRQRVIAKLAPGPKRPAPPVKAAPTSPLKSTSTSSRVPSLTPITAAPASTSQPSSAPSAVAVPDTAVPAMAPVAASVAAPIADIPSVAPVVVIPAAVPATRQYGWLTVQMPDNYRQGTEGKRGHIVHIVQISDRVWNGDSLIPSTSTGRKRRARLPGRSKPATIPLTRTPIPNQHSPVFLPHTISQFPRRFAPVYLPRYLKSDKIRGRSKYCPARPHFPGERGGFGFGTLYKGRTCTCCEDDGSIPLRCYNIPPTEWATTPAESGIDPDPPKVRTDRPRKAVRFADDLIHTFAGVRDPAASFIYEGKSKDGTTREQDFPEGFPLYEDEPRRRFGFRQR
ncbi:MAG: hypothetical protein Q9161_004116 [Pseudevernia consocians]